MAAPTALQCLVMAARHHGVHLSVEQLIRAHGLGPEEPEPRQVATVAAAHGLTAGQAKLCRRDLAKLAPCLPALIRLKNGNTVLLTAVAGKGESAMATVLVFFMIQPPP